MRRLSALSALCRDCQACTLACSLHHERLCSPSLARLSISKDMARYEFQITICRHCDDPDCLQACPSGALVRKRNGIVVMKDDDCSLCGLCADACPYNAIFYHQAANRYLKCDLCAGRAEGPLCVAVCPVGAITLEAQGGAA